MSVSSSRLASIKPNRSSGAQRSTRGGEDGGVGNIAEEEGRAEATRALNQMARRIQRGKTSQIMEQMATTNTGSLSPLEVRSGR